MEVKKYDLVARKHVIQKLVIFLTKLKILIFVVICAVIGGCSRNFRISALIIVNL